jgi:pseudouridine synthase
MTAEKPGGEQAGIRINRYLSMAGVASRRKAEELVLGGRVSINGAPVTDLAARVNPRRDRVTVDGKHVHEVQTMVYLVMNKPKDAITTVSDEKGRRTVMSLLQSHHRVFPVGRLDRNTTGVLLFTNDGELAARLMHPKFKVAKVYYVTTDKPVTRAHVERLRGGVKLDDRATAPAEVYVLPEGKHTKHAVGLVEGRNRQVRRMFETLGYEVVKLDRVAYGPVTKHGLARGESRSLTRKEVRALRTLAGLEIDYGS